MRLRSDLFLTFFFPKDDTHNCILIFWDCSPEEDPLFLGKLDSPHGGVVFFFSFDKTSFMIELLLSLGSVS